MTLTTYSEIRDYVLSHRPEIRAAAKAGSDKAYAVIEAYAAFHLAPEENSLDQLSEAVNAYMEAKQK